MIGGEVTSEAHQTTFQPNSTYTWRTDNDSASPIHTFATSSQVLGTAPVQPSTGPDEHDAPVAGHRRLGHRPVPGNAEPGAARSASGKAEALSYKGKSVKHLTAGRYTFAITDRSLLERIHTPEKP